MTQNSPSSLILHRFASCLVQFTPPLSFFFFFFSFLSFIYVCFLFCFLNQLFHPCCCPVCSSSRSSSSFICPGLTVYSFHLHRVSSICAVVYKHQQNQSRKVVTFSFTITAFRASTRNTRRSRQSFTPTPTVSEVWSIQEMRSSRGVRVQEVRMLSR